MIQFFPSIDGWVVWQIDSIVGIVKFLIQFIPSIDGWVWSVTFLWITFYLSIYRIILTINWRIWYVSILIKISMYSYFPILSQFWQYPISPVNIDVSENTVHILCSSLYPVVSGVVVLLVSILSSLYLWYEFVLFNHMYGWISLWIWMLWCLLWSLLSDIIDSSIYWIMAWIVSIKDSGRQFGV